MAGSGKALVPSGPADTALGVLAQQHTVGSKLAPNQLMATLTPDCRQCRSHSSQPCLLFNAQLHAPGTVAPVSISNCDPISGPPVRGAEHAHLRSCYFVWAVIGKDCLEVVCAQIAPGPAVADDERYASN
jgi:hypothetical protein